jgi:BirA family biotin operon repressor/biotin-[acetyl-CoA-carboxylase] ligase
VRVIRFDTIDSTNAEAHRLAVVGECGPLWIVAREQTGGRGRLGRTWISQPGNLYCTRLFAVRCGARIASQVGFVASLAVRDMAAQLLGSDIGLTLKWPNDVLRNGAKFCGILPEVLAQQSSAETIVALGIGINLAHAPCDMPYPVTALGGGISPEAAFEALGVAFDRRLAQWDAGRNFAAIRESWQRHALGIGAPATASGETGVFRGLADDGALILELANGERRPVHSGEVGFGAFEKARG